MELLERLINAYGVSGNEEGVRRIILEAMEPLVDEVRVDSSGNVIARKRGKKPNFMLAAHMDEIGLMVREITNDGLLLCAAVGGIIPVSMIGTRVTVQGADELIHGIVTTRAVSCGEDVDDMPGVEDLVVDTGLSQEKLNRLGITVGAFLEPRKEINWLTFGNTISGKALDDRLGCYCLIEVARRLQRVNQEVYYAFTVQEEVGVQGAKTSAFAIHPRWAIVVDITPANDLSAGTGKAVGSSLVLGKGPCLLHMEEGFIPNTKLVRAIRKVADRHRIPIQHEVSSFGATDASKISAVRHGVPCANISIAIRNVHSTVEIANHRDVEACIRLLSELLKHPPASLCQSLVRHKEEKRVTKMRRSVSSIQKRRSKTPRHIPKAHKKRSKKGHKSAKRRRS